MFRSHFPSLKTALTLCDLLQWCLVFVAALAKLLCHSPEYSERNCVHRQDKSHSQLAKEEFLVNGRKQLREYLRSHSGQSITAKIDMLNVAAMASASPGQLQSDELVWKVCGDMVLAEMTSRTGDGKLTRFGRSLVASNNRYSFELTALEEQGEFVLDGCSEPIRLASDYSETLGTEDKNLARNRAVFKVIANGYDCMSCFVTAGAGRPLTPLLNALSERDILEISESRSDILGRLIEVRFRVPAGKARGKIGEPLDLGVFRSGVVRFACDQSWVPVDAIIDFENEYQRGRFRTSWTYQPADAGPVLVDRLEIREFYTPSGTKEFHYRTREIGFGPAAGRSEFFLTHYGFPEPNGSSWLWEWRWTVGIVVACIGLIWMGGRLARR